MKRDSASTAEHYDLLIDEIDDPALPMVIDPFWDSGVLRAWMAQADGPAFWQAVGEAHECLEVAPPVAVQDAISPGRPLLATVIAARKRDGKPALLEG